MRVCPWTVLPNIPKNAEIIYDGTVTRAGTKNMIEDGNEDESIHDYDDDEYVYCEDYCNHKRDVLMTTTWP